MTVKEWIDYAEARLRSLEIEASSMEAQLLAAHVLRVDRTWLFAHPEAEFNDLAGEQLLERRSTGEPLAYILGRREFFGRDFGVDPTVLIPRHETETLIEAALRYFPAQANPIEPSEISVLDIGTGSGAIAITLALERPNWSITAVDISAEALSTAAVNAKFHRANVKFVLSDAFESLLGESYDLIVTNPPYIGREETLPIEVRNFEPELALFAEEEGLAFYRLLAAKASSYLADGGILVAEVGYSQSEKVAVIFEAASWTLFDTVRDLSGIARVLAFKHDFDCEGE